MPLPTSPYPGLRPFLDHEDMLMHGRQTQVADVVRRLGRLQRSNPAGAPSAGEAAPLTRFVAVIGGSGSGKSSLIRAGVVPYLRQFGIPEAGDLWEAVVCTPGTNFQPDADGVVHESPITRLAAKFERQLRGERNAQRCDAIAQMLRRDGGLGRVVDEFGPQLSMPSGVRPEDTCVLLVIDQFEELFHKTNAGSADARALVERVIDHFHEAKRGQGSSKCFLAITMRSEHLNDCAGYLGLPEAINSGGYLVSRLGAAQLRDVIEKPAQRYLRLRQRERQAQERRMPPGEAVALPALPRSVVFEDGVVDTLVMATGQIEHDPDHLPLLQHALARTWSAACAREGLQVSDVPAMIKATDLWRAGQAEQDPPAPPAGKENLLRACLDSWAEHTLRSHPPADQHEVMDLMRRLAYKDLRTGSYNQQRLYVNRHPLGADRLHALVQGRWIDDVDYLHWDDEDQQHVTLKVSHESFIRGWRTLRELADREAARLDRFMQLVDATQLWLKNGRQDAELLDQRLFDRMTEAQVDAALGPLDPAHDDDPETATWEDWHRWLAQMPRGEPLNATTRGEVRSYLRRSRDVLAQIAREVQAQEEAAIQAREAAARSQAEADRAVAKFEQAEAEAEAEKARSRAERAEALAREEALHAEAIRKRKRRRVWVTALASAGLLSFFAFAVMVPVTVRSQHYFKAAGDANEVNPSLGQEKIGGSLADLKKLLGAAEQFQKARSPDVRDDPWTHRTAGLADSVLTWYGVRRLNLATLLPDAAAAVEPVVNKQLRQVLTQSLWLTTAPPDSTAALVDAGAPVSTWCDDRAGTVTPVGGNRAGDTERRGVFIAGEDGGRHTITADRPMYSARLASDGYSGAFTCKLGRPLFLPIEPNRPMPEVMFDALLGYMLLAETVEQRGVAKCGSPNRVSLLRLRWDNYEAGGNAESVGPLAVVTNDCQAAADLGKQVRQTQGSEGNVGVSGATLVTPGGRAFRVNQRWWRLVSESANRLEPAPKPDDLLALTDAGDTGACGDIRAFLLADFQRQNPGDPDTPDLTALVEPTTGRNRPAEHCLVVQRTAIGEIVQFNLQVFRVPGAADRDDDGRLFRTKLVGNVDFGRLPAKLATKETWLTGKPGGAAGDPGRWEGWLILKREVPNRSNKSAPPTARYLGLPWSTAALRQLGEELCLSHLLASDRKATAPAPSRQDCYPQGRPAPSAPAVAAVAQPGG